MLNRDPKLVKLHMGHQIGPNKPSWIDFCHTKNLKFVPPPTIIRCHLMEGEKWVSEFQSEGKFIECEFSQGENSNVKSFLAKYFWANEYLLEKS